MPSFTSSVISSADLGTWNYYVMSDNTPLWRALNGLAAWFNGSGGLLQGGAWVGALIALVLVIFGSAVGKKNGVSTGVIGTWFFFMASMGMTGTANVVNIYNGTITTVANVPALALVPASMFSSAAYKVFTTMETSFASVNGSYMSVSANGFVGPLDLLLTLRSNKFPTSHPALQRTLTQVVHDCGIDPFATAPAAVSMKDTLDVLAWLKANGRQSGLTTIYSENDLTGKGDIASCVDGLDYIDDQYTAMAGGNTAMMKFINENSGKVNPASTTGNWSSTAINDSFNTLTAGIVSMSQDSIEFTKNSLVSATVSGTLDCLGNSGMMTSPDLCATSAFAIADGQERWKTDAAMSGSGFIKMMFTSMGFLQVLFFSLFPFIALYGLIVINKTAAVFGGYILFGVWSQSWMLIVVPIQAYIQNSVIDELTRVIGTGGGMTMANQSAIYTVLSNKLAVASDMMANSQMLSLALLSGSIYALSGLVAKSSGGARMDSGLLQRKTNDGSALVTGGSVMKMSTMAGSNGSSLVVGTRTGATTLGLGSSGVTTLSSGSTTGKESSVSIQKSDATARLTTALTGMGFVREQGASLARNITNALGYQGSINSGMGGAFMKALRTSAAQSGTPLTAAQEKVAGQMFNSAQKTAVNSMVAADPSLWGRLTSDNAAVKSGAYQEVAEKSIDLLAAGSTVAGIAAMGMTAGAATPAALGVASAVQLGKAGAKTAVKSKIKDIFADEAKDAVLSQAGQQANKTLRNVQGGSTLGRFGDAISGNVGATASAAHMETFKSEDGVSAKKSNSRQDQDSATVTATAIKTLGDTVKWGYSESASQSYVQTAALTRDMAGLANVMRSGYGDKSGEELRQDYATTRAVLMADAASGKYSPRDVKAAEAKVKDALKDEVFSSNIPGVSSDDIRTGVENALFQQFLQGKAQTGFGSDNPIPGGTDMTPQTAIAATETPQKAAPVNATPGKGKAKTSGSAQVKDPALVSAVNGVLTPVPMAKGTPEKIGDAVEGVKDFFGVGDRPDAIPANTGTTQPKSTSGATAGKTNSTSKAKNPNFTPSKASSAGGDTQGESGAGNGNATGAGSLTFGQQPSSFFENLPPIANSTANEREGIVDRGRPEIGRIIDAESKNVQKKFDNSSSARTALDNFTQAQPLMAAAQNQESNVNTAVITAAAVDVGAGVIGGAADMIQDGIDRGRAPTTGGSGGTGQGTGGDRKTPTPDKKEELEKRPGSNAREALKARKMGSRR